MKKFILSAILLAILSGPAWAGTITPTVTVGNTASKLFATTIKWTNLTAANASGAAADCRGFRTLEVQIKGTWNTGTVAVQGSNDGTNYVTLYSIWTQAAISHSSDPTILIDVRETPSYVKPVLSGAGTDTVTVTLVGRN